MRDAIVQIMAEQACDGPRVKFCAVGFVLKHEHTEKQDAHAHEHLGYVKAQRLVALEAA